MRAWIVFAAACGGPPPAPLVSPVTTAPRTADRSARVPRPRLSGGVDPSQLAAPGVVDTIAHAARLAHYGPARWTLTGTTLHGARGEPSIEVAWPVVDEVTDHVRIVIDRDDARLALWVERANLAPVAAVDTPVVPTDDTVSSRGKAELRAGAPVTLGTRRGNAQHVSLLDDQIAVSGWVDRDAIGGVFTIDHRSPPTAPVAVGSGVAIRPRASTATAALATTKVAQTAAVAGEAPAGWHQITVTTTHARVRGFVETADLDVGELHSQSTHRIGAVYTITHHVDLPVPTGTCIYDGLDGEIVGVNTITRTRLAQPDFDNPGWWRVAVDTPWNLQLLWVRDLAPSYDVNGAQLESCAPDP